MSELSEQRPWGSWHVLAEASGYKVKRIHVHPGHRLSLQSHQHRSEHWLVMTGIATCEIDDVTVAKRAGESVDVPLGARHRLGNATLEPLMIIEVQRGSYTGEDDIVRHEDDYGRSPMGAS
ncbi:MAG: mannose-6-phosphate isomerase, type 2 [Marmoricola sp.]|nr:mannose-6-phosphate isomerase, type 2 [Marmoricola sp.]